jgi:uncharacterized membrane protein YgdD (TMEM256/DUF423 family)
MTTNKTQTTLAAVLGALAVILGAFGAHGLKAAHYHLAHAVSVK